MLDKISCLCFKFYVHDALLVLFISTVIGQGYQTYNQFSQYSAAACTSYRETVLFTPCPRWICTDQRTANNRCCYNHDRDAFGNIIRIECVCDPAIQCGSTPVAASRSLDRSLGDDQKYCSHRFELEFFKPCHMDYCSMSTFTNVCCNRQQSFSHPEACLCHPDASCGLARPDTSEIADGTSSARDTTTQRYCSYKFELQFFQMCHMDFCSKSEFHNEFVCCKRRQTSTFPETCICHPESSCDLTRLSSEEDSDDSSEEEVDDESSSSESGESRDCSQRFELEFYKPCHTDVCSKSIFGNDYACCMRRESIYAPETCLCHPESTCDLTKPEPSTEDVEDKSGKSSASEDEETSTSRSLCADSLRLLNADKVQDQCQYMGVAKITRKGKNSDVIVCNAVYTTAQIDGVVQRAFLTPQACGILLQQQSQDLELKVEVGDLAYPVQEPIFSTSEGPNGNYFIRIASSYTKLFEDLGSCQRNACPYNFEEMRGKVDFNNCKVVSWGASDAATFTADGLYETSIALYPGGCLDQEDFFGVTNTLCFQTTDNENAYCANDAGAPVYCRSPSTKEWILVGMLAFQNQCDTHAELKVIPFPL